MQHDCPGSSLTLPIGLLAVTLLAASVVAQPPPLGSPRYPPQNQHSQAKATLGKILFFEEQLSSDNTMACATCHSQRDGGAEVRLARHPGRDSRLGTADDVFGSPGTLASDANNDYLRHGTFDYQPQVTRRAAMPVIMAAYSPLLFWDGRASDAFVDPQTSTTLIPRGGALETQSLGPILDPGEMGHAGRTFSQVTSKLATVRPMALASNLPADISAALTGGKSYGDLFRAAFGDSGISAARIALAIATYERTLVPNQAPWDRFNSGTMTALSTAQQRGLGVFVQQCAVCHSGELFTNNTFRNIGLRPSIEDTGRQEVTNVTADRGRFKVPSLRNVALRKRFMHTGQFTTLAQVVDFYAGTTKNTDNLDPAVRNIRLNGGQRADLVDFLTNGLTDPRVPAGTAPFDAPTLRSQRPLDVVYGSASPTQNPPILLHTPTYVGSIDFRVGIGNGRANAAGLLAVASSRTGGQASRPTVWIGSIPLNIDASTAVLLPLRLDSAGSATLHTPIPNQTSLRGQLFHAQGFVDDGSAPGGIAATAGHEVVLD